MAFTPTGAYSAEQQGLFGTQPMGPSFQDYVYSQNNPGYGVNGAYLTPNYTNAYRPSYGGPTGNPNPWQTGATLGQSAWYAANALPIPGAGFGTTTPYYQSATGMLDYHTHNMVSALPDAGATVIQSALPFASVYAAQKMMGASPFFARGAKATLQAGFGMGVRESIGARAGAIAGRTLGGAFGGLAGGATRGLVGLGSVSGGAAAFGGAGAFVGSALGSIAAPLIVGQGLYNVANNMIIDPYIQQRRGAEIMKSNLYGMAIGGEGGAAGGGLGLSSKRAYEISAGVNQAAFKDFGFKDSDYTSMLDYSMQAGLFEGFSGSDFNQKKVVEKTKEIAASVKQIMSVFGEKDMREAIGILAKFSKMGVNVGSAQFASGMGSLRAASAYTGKSAGELMETVFTPGAYSFQAAGMNGVLGGRVATDAYRGYEAALKTGLVSKGVLASLGGAEGAAQLATNATLGLANTQYNQMAAYNQFFSGRAASGIAGNLNAFAQGMGGDPMRAAGNMALYGNQMLDRQLGADRFASQKQVADLLRAIKPGAKNAADYAAVLTQSFGMSPEAARATVIDIQQNLRGNQYSLMGNMATQDIKQTLESDGLTWTNLPTIGAARGAYVGAKRGLSAVGSGIAQGIGFVSDTGAMVGDYLQYGIQTRKTTGKQAGVALSVQGAGLLTEYSAKGGRSGSYERERADKLTSMVNTGMFSLNPHHREIASRVMNKGVVDIKAFTELKAALGDDSLSVTDVLRTQSAGISFSGKSINYGNIDVESYLTQQAESQGIFGKGRLTTAQADKYTALEVGFANAKSEDELASFSNSNFDTIKELGLRMAGNEDNGVARRRIKDPVTGKMRMQSFREANEDRIRSATPGSYLGEAIAGEVRAKLSAGLSGSKEGGALYTKVDKGIEAAKQALASDTTVTSGLNNWFSNTFGINETVLKKTSAAASATAGSANLRTTLMGIDFQTGIDLDAATGGPGDSVEKGGAMIIKASVIMAQAATMQYEAAGKNKDNQLYKELAAATGSTSPIQNQTTDSGSSSFSRAKADIKWPWSN